MDSRNSIWYFNVNFRYRYFVNKNWGIFPDNCINVLINPGATLFQKILCILNPCRQKKTERCNSGCQHFFLNGVPYQNRMTPKYLISGLE